MEKNTTSEAPSLLYMSPQSMKIYRKNMTRIRLANFDKETSHQTRASSNAKNSLFSGKRKAPQTTLKEKEPPKKKKVKLKECVREPESQTQLDLEDGDFSPTPLAGELGKKDRTLPILTGRFGFICAKCGLKYLDLNDPLLEETKWVFCLVCEVTLHTTCIASGRICKYKPIHRHIN